MTESGLLRYARHTANDYQQEAARQHLANAAVRAHPIYGLERTYYFIKGLFWFAAALPAALYILLLQDRGVTLGEIGLFYGLYAIVVAFLEVPSGMLADLWGRKPVTLLGYALATAAQLALFFAFSPALLLLWALLSGSGRALTSGALEAWFVDAVEEAAPGTEMQPLFARAETVELLALTFGTLIGGALPKLFARLPGGAILSPLSVVLLVSVAVGGVLFAVALWSVHETRPAQTKQQVVRSRFRELLATAFSLGRQLTLRLLFGGALLGGFALAGLETFWQPRFAELLGPDTLILSVILAGSFGAGMIGNLASIPFCRFLGGRYALVAALTQALGGAAFIALALQMRIVPAVLLFWMVYLTLGLSSSPRQTLLNRAVPSGARAALLSVASLMTYLGFFAGSVALGRIAEQVSVAAAWGVAGVVFTLAVGFYLKLATLTRTSPQVQRAG